MNIIELNHIDLNSIGLNSKVVDGIGKSHGGKIKPYIKGHVTDGSNIYQLKIGNTSINVPVNENGWFKWADIKEYKTALETQQLWVNPNNGSLDVIEICINNMTLFRVNTTPSDTATNYSLKIIDFKNSNITITGRAIGSYNCVNVEEIKNTKKIKLISTDTRAIRASFYKTVALKNLPYMCNYQFLVEGGEYEMMIPGTITKIDGLIPIVSTALNQFGSLPNLEEILDCAEILYNVSFAKSSKLTAQSVVNLFNAVAADGITLMFHQNVWNMIMREIDVQGSSIQVAYQNMIDNYDVTIANASFDAEIEYLEGSGTQYIDTLVIPNTNTKMTCDLEITNQSMSRFGVIDINTNRFHFSFWDTNNKTYGYLGISSTGMQDVGYTDNLRHTIMLNSTGKIGYDETIYDKSYQGQMPNLSIWLFGRNSDNAAYREKGCYKIYSTKIEKNNVLVLDLIPVRKGTTGYLYDKVSGNLFGNSGTGDFILGNDK